MAKKKTNKQRVYVITLSGQGDIYIKLVDKETWDWIFSPWAPPKKNDVAYVDTTCPPKVLARMVAEDEEAEPYITRGSYENDRALRVEPVYGPTFFSVVEAMNYPSKNKLKIIDSWEGYVY